MFHFKVQLDSTVAQATACGLSPSYCGYDFLGYNIYNVLWGSLKSWLSNPYSVTA
jgi:hypothetical protein